MLEYGKNASPENPHGYVVPEIRNEKGSYVKWSDLLGMSVGFQTKLEAFTSNKNGETLYSNKVATYASKNPLSAGYKFYEAISKGIQPWQKPLSEMAVTKKGKSQPMGPNDFELPPVEAYNDGQF